MCDNKTILEVKNLKKYFPMKKRLLKAVDDVSFTLYQGETLGIVGESSCGKTTCGRTCLGIYPKTGGTSLYKGKDVHTLTSSERKVFTREVQCIFQDPFSSLNPRMRVKDIISEGMGIHKLYSSHSERDEMVEELLHKVGLHKEHGNRYPHEFSGGQRQRVGIARALAVNPQLILCDEPISALDVSVQAQIINLLVDIQKDQGLTYLFISHDISIVKYVSNRIAVFYMGKIVELGDANDVYYHPFHPYSKILLSSLPLPDPREGKKRHSVIFERDVQTSLGDTQGCVFYHRCPIAVDACAESQPAMRELKKNHFVSCYHSG